ncbi:putative PGG domain-containing protein [Medicago truncatula]|uniref:Putative PGG domain-containing protein n=1 Tax=Medicago truncatula TaxID=3880 RepID=A0A396H794_MEDTR|nr:putative PGG domain-containing protein [Medicago truncatula]
MEGVVVQNGTQVLPGSSWANNQFTRYEKDQGNRMEQMRGSLMVVATVMASLTFQIAINPPGGVWQSKAEHAALVLQF